MLWHAVGEKGFSPSGSRQKAIFLFFVVPAPRRCIGQVFREVKIHYFSRKGRDVGKQQRVCSSSRWTTRVVFFGMKNIFPWRFFRKRVQGGATEERHDEKLTEDLRIFIRFFVMFLVADLAAGAVVVCR